MMTLETIEKAARQLSVEDRILLTNRLLQDLEEGFGEEGQFLNAEIEAAWVEESERRLDAYLRGEMGSIEGDEAVARLYARFK